MSVSADGGPQERPAGLGAILRAAREKQRLSFHQLSEELRIEPKFLIALEEERFDALGVPVFVKGYLKNYSEALGLDSRPLLETYRSRYGQDETLLVQARKSIERGQEPPPIGTWIAAGMAVALVGAFFWLRPGSDRPMSTEREARAVPSPAAISAGGEASSAASSNSQGVGTPSAAASVRSPVAARAAPADGSAGPVERSAIPPSSVSEDEAPAPAASEAEARAPAVSAAEAQARAPASSVSEAPATAASVSEAEARIPAESLSEAVAASTGLALELRFIEDSWAEITARDNERVFYGLGRAGSEARFTAAPPVAVLLGNADGVDLLVEGETFPYPDGSRRGRLARFTLSAAAE